MSKHVAICNLKPTLTRGEQAVALGHADALLAWALCARKTQPEKAQRVFRRGLEEMATVVRSRLIEQEFRGE